MVNGIKSAPQVTATDVATQKLLARIQAGYDPADDKNVQQLAHNTVQTWQMLQLLMKGAPSKADAAGLTAYNAALVLGTTGTKVDKGTAISKLRDAHTDMLAALASRMTSREDAGTDAGALGNMLTEIKDAISTRNEVYGVYNAYGVPRAALQGTLAGETPAAAPQVGIKTGVTEDVAIMPPTEHWRGSILVTSAKQQSSLFQLRPPGIPEQLNEQFRVDHPNDPAGTIYQGSRDVMQCYSDIVKFSAQPGADMKGADAIRLAHDLANALSAVPANAPIRTDRNSPFNLAVQALSNGNLLGGLAMLGGSTVFNNPDFFSSINNLFILATNPREYVVMRPGINLRWNFVHNQRSWMNYLTGHGTRGEGGIVSFDPKSLYCGLALNYATTILSGQWQRMQYTPEGMLIPTAERGLLTGRGSAIEGTGTWAEAIGLLGQPMEFVFNLTGGHKEAHMDAKQQTLADGTQITVPAQDYHLNYLGIVSLDLNFRDKAGKRSRFSILPPASVGGGVIPDYDFVNNQLLIKGANWFGYMTFLWTSAAKNDWTCQMMVTPEISSIMKDLRLGGQITPFEFTQQTEKHVLQLGATAKEEYNLKTYVSTIDLAGKARYVGTVFNFPLDVLARAGYGWETGGSPLDRVRAGPFLSVDVTIPVTKSLLSGIKPKRE